MKINLTIVRRFSGQIPLRAPIAQIEIIRVYPVRDKKKVYVLSQRFNEKKVLFGY